MVRQGEFLNLNNLLRLQLQVGEAGDIKIAFEQGVLRIPAEMHDADLSPRREFFRFCKKASSVKAVVG